MHSFRVFGLIFCLLGGGAPVCARDEAPPAPPCEASAPVPGLPIPMDASRAESLRLARIHVRMALGQHRAQYSVYCTIRSVGHAGKPKPVQIGLPLLYEPALGARRLPISRAASEISVSWDDKQAPSALIEGQHPHAQLPPLADWGRVRYWIAATVTPDAENRVLAYHFTVPLAESGVTAPPTALFRLAYLPAWGGARAESGTMETIFSELYPAQAATNMNGAAESAPGVLAWDFLNRPAADGGSDARIEAGGALSPDGKTWKAPARPAAGVRVHADYRIAANCTGGADPMGSPCSAENLKKAGAGFWKSDGTTVPELLITPDSPKRTLALLIRSGLTPEIQAAADPAARTHPETTFAMHARPSRVRVDVNEGEKVYTVHLRDDWQPQLLTLLDTGSPVKSIRLTLEQAYTGTGGQECYLQSIELVDPAR